VNSRVASLLAVISLWAVLYLPVLGSLELRGEEGKRVIPAARMLDCGNYLVPLHHRSPTRAVPFLRACARVLRFNARGIAGECPVPPDSVSRFV